MTKAKKMLGMVMAALLCFALTPMAAFAAAQPMTGSGNVGNTKGEITITNAIPEQEYSIYEIFQLESYNNDAKAYSYKLVSEDWKPFYANGAEGAPYVSIDGQGYVTLKSGADMAAFAKAAIKFAEDNGIEPTETKTAGKAAEGAETVRLEFTGLELGYYLVSSSVGTLCSLDSTNPSVDITDKNEKPSVTKKVQENSKVKEEGEGWGSDNNANIGEAVNFRSTITGQAGALNYVFTDKMSSGLTLLPETISVTFVPTKQNDENARAAKELVEGTDYAFNVIVTPSLNPNPGTEFTIAFSEAFCTEIMANDQILIEYSAVLNEDAVISGDANTNDVVLSYGNGTTTMTTPPSHTDTYTGGINVFKHNEAGEGLAGAEFVLSKSADATDVLMSALSLVQLPADDERAEANVPTYRLATGNDEEVASTIVTDESGRFKIVGLDVDTYYLHETKAPDGYNKLATAKEVEVTEGAEGVVNFGDADVVNKTGLELPSTGGIGTMILYVIGGLLVLGAIVVLVRRRSSAK